MKNKLALLLIVPLLLLSACGQQEYQTGAMTDDASLTLTWDGEELVLDAVTLATLVTTELFYATESESGAAEEDVSVVFDLPKYLAGEGWDLARCRTWVLTDRQGRSVFVPVEEAEDSLYIGITSGTENLDYPVSVIPEGPSSWKVWELAQVDFRVEKAQVLMAAAEQAAAAERLQAAREAVEGVRHIALARGLGRDGIKLTDLVRENLPEEPEGTVRILTEDGRSVDADPEPALAAEYSGGQALIGGKAVRCLSYGRQALWLGGPVSVPELFTAAGMIKAEDYSFFAVSGANVKLALPQIEEAAILENDAGGLDLVYGDGRLTGVISVTAGRPVVEEESL